jgi:CubicO group peptidase (beta-lactamase class C family)
MPAEGKIMFVHRLALLALLVAAGACGAAAQTAGDKQAAYYPDATWQHKTPAESGINPQLLKEAIDAAIAGETKAPRDLVMNHYQTFGREPFGYPIGPIKERGDPTGLIIRHGYIVAEWGDPLSVDMTHSVTKSFLSSVVGVAVDRGMIRSINDTVREYVAPIQLYVPLAAGNKSDRLGAPDLLSLFETPHNRTITWDNMLRQTSDWEGTLWGKPAQQAGHRVQVQRHPRQRAGARGAQCLAAPAAAGAEGIHHGPDRRLEYLALVRLREFLDRPRRQPSAVGDRRRALGRRHVYQRL